jgi:hypothetical protein
MKSIFNILTDEILSIQQSPALIIGVDGVDGAGKTCFAAQLKKHLEGAFKPGLLPGTVMLVVYSYYIKSIRRPGSFSLPVVNHNLAAVHFISSSVVRLFAFLFPFKSIGVYAFVFFDS